MTRSSAGARPLPPLESSGCVMCELPLRDCWQFRHDDRFCGLCGKEILGLRAGQGQRVGTGIRASFEPMRDRWLLLYFPPERDPDRDRKILLCLAWRRGAAGKKSELSLPALDLERCQAVFSGRLDSTTFEWKAAQPSADAAGKAPSFAVVSLRPHQVPRIPTEGLQGKVVVAAPPLQEEYRALLLPWPEVKCVCKETSLAGPDGVLQFHQPTARRSLEMELRVTARAWMLGCVADSTAGANRVELSGLGPEPVPLEEGERLSLNRPLELIPDRPRPFRVAVDSSRWQPGQEQKLSLTFHLHSLPPLTFEFRLALTQGCRLTFEGGNDLILQKPVQLGQVEPVGFALTVSADDGVPAEPIRIETWEVLSRTTTPGAGDWLQVVHPARGTSLELKPGERGQLELQIDTRHLDRDAFHDKALEGDVRLIDSRKRPWVCSVRAVVRRPQQMPEPVAFDWGTTNSVAAFLDGNRKETIPLDDKQAENRERFPSDMFFRDLSDAKNPKFDVGHLAEINGRGRPECHVRSLKRLFQFRKDVQVNDPQGHRATYPVETLVLLLLQRLISEAERSRGREIAELSLTFPTKWPPSVRKRFVAVRDRLQAELEARRKSTKVIVRPPEIDEANAVAIDLVTSEWIKQKKEVLPRFILVAYDFGGGTVDTSVLEVELAPGQIRTRYIGIGGREDFGGDDVTRAVMELMHRKLTRALQKHELKVEAPDGTAVLARLESVPLTPKDVSLAGSGPDAAHLALWGRRVWETLWRVAETVKARPQADEVTGHDWLKTQLSAHLGRIYCLLKVKGGGKTLSCTLDTVLAGCSNETEERIYKDSSFRLAEAWKEPLADLDGSNGGREFTVEDRINDTIEELRWQCQQAGVTPDVVVLAGGGSRLALVRQAVLGAFNLRSEDYVISNAADSKQRVAYGLARYLTMTKRATLRGGLARSVDVLHHALGVFGWSEESPLEQEFRPVVPVGAAIDAPGVWHGFLFRADQMRGRQLVLSAQVWRDGARVIDIGYFDFDRPQAPPQGDEPCEVRPLPDVADEPYEAELRLRGPQRVELRVGVGEKRYGLYVLEPELQGADLEDLLQGPARFATGGGT